jgi:hypothetical protein
MPNVTDSTMKDTTSTSQTLLPPYPGERPLAHKAQQWRDARHNVYSLTGQLIVAQGGQPRSSIKYMDRDLNDYPVPVLKTDSSNESVVAKAKSMLADVKHQNAINAQQRAANLLDAQNSLFAMLLVGPRTGTGA